LPDVAAELPRLLQSSEALIEVPAGPWAVLRVVNGWGSLDSFNIHTIARSGQAKTLHSTL